MQSLYEKKLLTYPRTDSQFITDDMEGTARQVIGIICRKVSIFDGLSLDPDIKSITNNAKVTDHHAIIPTVQLEKQDISELPESEQKIIRLIAMRLLSSTGEKHIYDETFARAFFAALSRSSSLTFAGFFTVKAMLNSGFAPQLEIDEMTFASCLLSKSNDSLRR